MIITRNHHRWLTLFLGALVFILLVGFNYFKAQKAILDTKPSSLGLTVLTYPEKLKVHQSGTFTWSVQASTDLSTSFTSIYWGYEASSSSLTVLDSPAAVGYPHTQTEYTSGVFKLPNTFDLRLEFDRPGRVWFRAYAKVRESHLWSDEYSLVVE